MSGSKNPRWSTPAGVFSLFGGFFLQIIIKRGYDLKPSVCNYIRAILILKVFANIKYEVRRLYSCFFSTLEHNRFTARRAVFLFAYVTKFVHAPEHEILSVV